MPASFVSAHRHQTGLNLFLREHRASPRHRFRPHILCGAIVRGIEQPVNQRGGHSSQDVRWRLSGGERDRVERDGMIWRDQQERSTGRHPRKRGYVEVVADLWNHRDDLIVIDTVDG